MIVEAEVRMQSKGTARWANRCVGACGDVEVKEEKSAGRSRFEIS